MDCSAINPHAASIGLSNQVSGPPRTVHYQTQIKRKKMLNYQIIQHKENNKDWVLLLHGLGGSSTIWYKQIADLSQSHNLLLPDFFGHGRTREVQPAYTFTGLVEEMTCLLDHLKIDRAHIMGISLGSIIASFMAVYNPERVKSLILGGATPGLDFRTRSLLNAGNALKYAVPYMWLYRFFAWIMMPRQGQRQGRRIFVREARKLGGKEFRKWYALMMQFPMHMLQLESPTLLQVPKLLISGSQDYLFLNQVLDWAKRDPDAKLHIIENCGHVCNIQAPAEFNRVCLEFLSGSTGSLTINADHARHDEENASYVGLKQATG